MRKIIKYATVLGLIKNKTILTSPSNAKNFILEHLCNRAATYTCHRNDVSFQLHRTQ